MRPEKCATVVWLAVRVVAATAQLKRMVLDLQRSVGQVSSRLVRQLTRRDRRLAKLSRNCDVVTAVLQAASLKRRE